MALTEADIEQFIAEMQSNPHLRDRVRDAILARDFLALPGIVDRLGERIEELVQQDAKLGERMDQLIEQVRQLTLRMDRFEGRSGNIEGRLYESNYRQNLPAHLAGALRNARRAFPADFVEIAQAFEQGAISEDDWDDVHRLDVLAVGRAWRSQPGAPEKILAIELSLVVDRTDVERAARRAGVLQSSGLAAEPAVDGEAILDDAQRLADQLGVTVLVRTAAPAA